MHAHWNPAELPYAPGLIVIDVSFISLTKVLPAVLACAAARYDCLAMIKPQFEVGRERIGKGGVVRDAAARRERSGVRRCVRGRVGRVGCRLCELRPARARRATVRRSSGSASPDAWGRGVADLEAAALVVEP